MIKEFQKNLKKIVQELRKEDGWTFIETLIVIGIILILSSTVGFMAFRYINTSKVAAAKNQIEMYSLALNSYFLDCKNFPGEEEGLSALWKKPKDARQAENWRGPYVNKKPAADPWGNPYQYQVPGPNNLPFGLSSFGADGTEGGEGDAKDIHSWE